MNISNSNFRHFSAVNELLAENPCSDSDADDMDEKMKKMQEMMGSMEEMNKAMLKTLYMQIFLAPEEKMIEW